MARDWCGAICFKISKKFWDWGTKLYGYGPLPK